MSDNFYGAPPPTGTDRPQPPQRRRVPAVVVGGLGGVAAGVFIAWGVAANASTPGSTPGSTATAPTAHHAAPPCPGHGHHAPGSSGSVTAIGAHSVTIKTSSGTKTYVVTSSSDIDKNGEAQLRDLRVGDKVTFDVETANGKTVIDHLHAGNEALDRPTWRG